jgi:protein-S-isoprenylcysteine O-methyltransferase Ste14
VETSNRASAAGAHLLFASSGILGAGSLLLFTIFLFAGPLGLVNLGLSVPAALALNTLLSVVFFLQHSVMTRSGFRERLARRVREELHGAVYSTVSGIVLLIVVVLWQGPTPTLVEAPPPMRWFLRGLFILSLFGFSWGSRALGPFDGLGLRAIRRHLRGGEPREPSFEVQGPYRWVRHPLYFFVLVLVWTYPVVTADRLLFNVVWTAWMVIGTVLEERDLVTTFGEPYREYQRRVPMLLPYRTPVRWPENPDLQP